MQTDIYESGILAQARAICKHDLKDVGSAERSIKLRRAITSAPGHAKGDTAAACDPLFAAFPIWSFQSLAASHFLDVVIELSTTSMKVAGSKGLVR